MDGSQLSFNTFIYEYFLKLGHYDIARAMIKEDKFQLRTTMDVDMRSTKPRRSLTTPETWNSDSAGDKIPYDLPIPVTMEHGPGKGFLFEWFSIFSDLYAAHNSSSNQKMGRMTQAATYLMLNRSLDPQAPRNPTEIATCPALAAENIAPIDLINHQRDMHSTSSLVSHVEAAASPPEIAVLVEMQRSNKNMQGLRPQELSEFKTPQRSNNATKRQWTTVDDDLYRAKKQCTYHNSSNLDEGRYLISQAVASIPRVPPAWQSPLNRCSPESSATQPTTPSEFEKSLPCRKSKLLHSLGDKWATVGEKTEPQRIAGSEIDGVSPAFSRESLPDLETSRSGFSDPIHEFEIVKVSSHEGIPSQEAPNNEIPASEPGQSLSNENTPLPPIKADLMSDPGAASVRIAPTGLLPYDYYSAWHTTPIYRSFPIPESYNFKAISTDTDFDFHADLTELGGTGWEEYGMPTSATLFPTCT